MTRLGRFIQNGRTYLSNYARPAVPLLGWPTPSANLLLLSLSGITMTPQPRTFRRRQATVKAPGRMSHSPAGRPFAMSDISVTQANKRNLKVILQINHKALE
jgi:hypothetical protein